MAKSIIGYVSEYSEREDSWQFYIDRLEQFFVANDVDNVEKRKLFCCLVLVLKPINC